MLAFEDQSRPDLPEASSTTSGRSLVPGLLVARRILLLAGEAAGDKDNRGTNEGEDGSDENQPDSGTPFGAADTEIVDILLDDAEGDEVGDHDHEGHDKGDERDDGGQERAHYAGADAEEEGNEAQAKSDGVKNHDTGQTLGRAGRGTAEFGAIEGAHQTSWVVADLGAGAVVRITTASRAVSRGP